MTNKLLLVSCVSLALWGCSSSNDAKHTPERSSSVSSSVSSSTTPASSSSAPISSVSSNSSSNDVSSSVSSSTTSSIVSSSSSSSTISVVVSSSVSSSEISSATSSVAPSSSSLSSSSSSSVSSSSDSSISSESSSSSEGPAPIPISGIATAPGGSVAAFEQRGFFQFVSDFFISPAKAEIIGLSPVASATVELIRVDNSGEQTGEVLADATTSINGEYSLDLPSGVNPSGDLVVRISGSNNMILRAQVVSEEADISPISEFVLQKLIANGANLSSVSSNAVVDLANQIDQFDMVAANDLTSTLNELDAQAGQYADHQINLMTTSPADASSISGSYRAAVTLSRLEDRDDGSYGGYAIESWVDTLELEGNPNGSVEITLTGERGGNALIDSSGGLNYESYIDDSQEVFSTVLNNDGTMSITSEVTDFVGEDSARRIPPTINRFQKVQDKNIFIQLAQEAATIYGTLNGELNINDRLGDEIRRRMEIFYQSPSSLTKSDIAGQYGRVYAGTELGDNGSVRLETEYNVLTFTPASSTLDVSEAPERLSITRANESTPSAAVETAAAEELTFDTRVNTDAEVALEGGEVLIDGETAGLFVNDTYDFLTSYSSDSENDNEATFDATLLVKLPSQVLTLTGKRYRLLSLDSYFDQEVIELGHSRFNSYIDWDTPTSGTLFTTAASISKDTLLGQVISSSEGAAELDITSSISANGAITITATDEGGTYMLKGYLNESGSLGVLTTRYTPTGSNIHNTLGLAVLVEIASQN